VLAALYEEPTVASALADRVGTSAQNVHYHLTNLRDADLVEVVDTWYSSKGVEMDVYAPAGDPLVLAAGREDRLRELRATVSGQEPERGRTD
jgi:DNA-binding transcriptional ArsR family regulator